jgi:hypothetical protein
MTRGLWLAVVGTLVGGLAAAQEAAPPFRYETQTADTYAAERARIVASALGFASWPRTTELYAPPPVAGALLKDSGRVGEAVRSCTTVPFEGEAWPECRWSWKATSEERKVSADDWLDLEVTQTPGGRAAQEYLVRQLSDNMLPNDMLEARYKAAARPERLGSVAFQVRSPLGDETSLSFVRGNLVFRLRARGALTSEVLPLAARLDESVLNQQPLTVEELRARRSEKSPRRP